MSPLTWVILAQIPQEGVQGLMNSLVCAVSLWAVRAGIEFLDPQVPAHDRENFAYEFRAPISEDLSRHAITGREVIQEHSSDALSVVVLERENLRISCQLVHNHEHIWVRECSRYGTEDEDVHGYTLKWTEQVTAGVQVRLVGTVGSEQLALAAPLAELAYSPLASCPPALFLDGLQHGISCLVCTKRALVEHAENIVAMNRWHP
jgi:hypothetical protein